MSTTYPDRAMIEFVRTAIEGEDTHATELTIAFPFRNRFHHCLRVSSIARMIAAAEGSSEELAAIAGVFHDVGKAAGKDHAIVSAELCASYLESIRLPDEKAAIIVDCVRHHSGRIAFENGAFPEHLAVLRDADVLDEVGAVGVAWTLLASGERRPDSYYTPLHLLTKTHLSSGGADHGGKMRTATGREMMKLRRAREREFIDQMTEELYVDSVEPWVSASGAE